MRAITGYNTGFTGEVFTDQLRSVSGMIFNAYGYFGKDGQ